MYKQVKCIGGPCYYLEYGQKNKTTILFLHGYSDSAETFEPLKKYLGEKYHVIIPDLPMIRRQGVTYDLQGLSHFVNEFVANLNLKKFTLCGFSFGGLVAADYAYWYPEKVKKLFLLNSVPRFLAPEMLDKLLIKLKPGVIPKFAYSLYSLLRSGKLGKLILPKTTRLEKTINTISHQPISVVGTVYEVVWHNIVGGTWTDRVRKFKKMPMSKAVVLFKDDEVVSYQKYATKLKRSGVKVITFEEGGHAETKKYCENIKTLF